MRLGILGSRRAHDAGFSLIEVIIVLAIIVILIGVGLPLVLRTLELAEELETKDRLELLAQGLRDFYRDHGRLPTSGEGLAALLSDPGTGAWQGPYSPIHGTETQTTQDARAGTIAYSVSGSVATLSPENFAGLTTVVNAAPVVQGWVTRAQQELAVINDAAEDYRAANGNYPTGLSDVVPDYAGSDYGTDPWGVAYALDDENDSFYSAGPDGSSGTADDVRPAGWVDP